MDHRHERVERHAALLGGAHHSVQLIGPTGPVIDQIELEAPDPGDSLGLRQTSLAGLEVTLGSDSRGDVDGGDDDRGELAGEVEHRVVDDEDRNHRAIAALDLVVP